MDAKLMGISSHHWIAFSPCNVIEWTKTKSNLQKVAQKLLLRKSQVLSLEKPYDFLAIHPVKAKKTQDVCPFKSFSMETIEHACH